MTREQAITKFEYLKEHKEVLNLLPGEEIAHCIDENIFDGEFNYPGIVISNKGRGYSLAQNIWIKPQLSASKNYWSFSPKIDGVTRTIEVHRLVAYYFRDESDQIAIDEWGKEGTRVHHIEPIVIPEELKDTKKVEERNKNCMKYNKKSNVCFQEEYKDHKDLTRLSNNQETKGFKIDGEVKENHDIGYENKIKYNMLYGNLFKYSRDEKGEVQRTFRTTRGLVAPQDGFYYIHKDGTLEEVEMIEESNYTSYNLKSDTHLVRLQNGKEEQVPVLDVLFNRKRAEEMAEARRNKEE